MITEAQRQDFANIQHRYIEQMDRPLPAEMWHYTSGEGLIGILETGQLFFTHVGCLNDNMEYRYFGDLVLEEIKRRHAANKEARLEPLYAAALDALTNYRDLDVKAFVACFSERPDDLGQWRGYGGGECGYGIVFDPERLFTAVSKQRPATQALPLDYCPVRHASLVHDIVDQAAKVFLDAPAQASGPRAWALEVLVELSQQVPLLSAIIKHPAFASEKERRLYTLLQQGEHAQLKFRQRKTLLARSLPVRATESSGRLPILKIVVGPGPAQAITRVSVRDLLAKHEYSNVPVEYSKVPYRVP
jgi:hypothetical protein